MRLRAASCSTRCVAATAALALCLARPAGASAAELPGARLSVSRSAGAESCADADALAQELSPRIAAENVPALSLVLSVDVARDGDAFVAAIHVEGRKHGERLLRAEGPTCDALHDALIVTLLMLLDEERTAAAKAGPGATTIPATPGPVPPPAAPQPPQREPPTQPAESAPERAEKSRLHPSLWLSAGGGATHGIPHEWSDILLFDLALRLGAFEISAGGFWGPQKTISANPGTITVGAWGERVRGCYALSPEHTRGTRLLGCAAGMHAALSGEASSVFVDTNSATRDWWLAGGSLEATYPLSSRIDVGIAFSALATLKERTFSVKGLPANENPVFDTDAVVGIAAARLEGRLF